jgi:hypothetical protein
VDIDLPRMLLELRALQAEGDETWETPGARPGEKALYRLWAVIVCHPTLYRAIVGLAGRLRDRWPAFFEALGHRVPPLAHWLRSRELPPAGGAPYREHWRRDLSGSRTGPLKPAGGSGP